MRALKTDHLRPVRGHSAQRFSHHRRWAAVTQAPENLKPHAIYQTFGVATHLMDMWTVQFTLVFLTGCHPGQSPDACGPYRPV